jgi:sigma-B regulation protein RsbU (phosphoserine phosphatase)
LLVSAVLATTGVVSWSSRRALLAETETQGLVIAGLLARSAAFGANVMSDVENAIGEQMVVEATMAAHLVALGEAAGVDPRAINRRLKDIADATVLDEIWITDEKGHAYLRNTDIDFTFSPDPKQQPQAHVFWPLLGGQTRQVLQEARQREVDTQVFKYVGVAGVDKPRIVQVGYHADLLHQLRQRMGLTRLVDQLVSDGSVRAIRVFDKSMVTVDYAERVRGPRLPEPTDRELESIGRMAKEGRTHSSLEGSLLSVAAPIGEQGGELKGGAILVTLPTDHVQAAIRSQARRAVAVSGLVLLLGSAIAVFGARTISRPITHLTDMTRRIAGGDFTRRIDIPARNEIGILAASFNEMSRRLDDSIEHLKETTAAKERMESELKIAHEIQMSMVPKMFPPFPDRPEFDIFAALVPAKEVGGDLYDFFFIDGDRLFFAIGDVSGKGVPAALFMAVTKTLLRATAGKAATPGETLRRLNEELYRDNDSCMFVTLFCGILDVRTGEIEYSNGGHEPPYHLSDRGVRPLENTGGGALGIAESVAYRSERLRLGSGESLFLYTDGVTEAMDATSELFSDRRLEQSLERARVSGPRHLVRLVVDEVNAFAAGVPQADDVTGLVLRYVGTGRKADGVEITLRNDLSELDRVSRGLDEFGAHQRLEPQVVRDLNLALEEILANIISYGYADDREHQIRVRLAVQRGEVEVDVEDDGRPFNPLDAPAPDTAGPVSERPVGGLGIHLVRNLMDGLEYERRGDRNRLVMRKRTERPG